MVTAVVQLRPLASELPAKRVAPQKSGTWVFDRYLFIFFVFVGLHPRPMEVSGLGVESEYSCQSTPQQRPIRAASVAYTTAHSNARSLTH